jgi:hypothetical protein
VVGVRQVVGVTASLLGIIAQQYVATPPPAVVVAPKRAGKPVSTVINTASSITAALPQTPTAGNLLIAVVTVGGPSATPTCTTPTGWTAGPVQKATSGAVRLGHFTFWKLATGSETNPAFTFNVTLQGGVVIQEWSGLDSSAPHLADSTGTQTAGSGTLTLTDAITTTTANEWVFTVVGVNLANTLTPITWTLPQLAFDAASNNAYDVKGGTGSAAWAAGCYASPGVKAPQAVATVAAGTTPVTGIVSMSFKIAGGTRPQVFESAYTEYSGTAVSSWAATLATTPDPADVLVCVVLHNDTLGAASITGCGATWTVNEVHDTAAKFDMHVWTGVDPTGAGAVTVTSANARTGKIRVLRVSGVGQSVTSAYNRTTGLSGTGPSVSAGPSQLVVALQALSGVGSADYPITSASPALGNWSTDAMAKNNASNGTMQDAWTTPAAPGTSHTVTGTAATSRDWPTAMVVVG